jgi:serine/threonine-protein kinase
MPTIRKNQGFFMALGRVYHALEVASEPALIAGRYRPVSTIGAGAHGEVWRATDAVTGSDVALKLLDAHRSLDPARSRREIAMLRLVRVPGVVRLLDDGVHEGRTFLVMELVPGAPFPGRTVQNDWPALAPIALGLLETLGRIHAAGVVHRDLKPANVLVDEHGRSTLLDFSISRHTEPSRNDVTLENAWHGTLSYLAPEQLLGEPATVATDLYAVGAMIYEALAGELPHANVIPAALVRAKINVLPRSLREVTTVPAGVADAVDRMLAIDASSRFGSAREVMTCLMGGGAPSMDVPAWLGSRDGIDRAVRALTDGRAVDVVAARSMGATRFVDEVEAELVRRGRRVVRATPSARPLGSLAAVTEDVDLPRREPLAMVTDRVRARLEALLSECVLLVDAVEHLDPLTASLLSKLGPGRPVLRVVESAAHERETVRLAPLRQAELEELFVGCDRLLHEREDAARSAFDRSLGVPGALFDDLASWVRAGIATRDGAKYAVHRDGLDLLESGLLPPAATAFRPGLAASLTPLARDVLGWISLAGSLPEPILGDVLGCALWETEAEIEQLLAADVIRQDRHGSLELAVTFRPADLWSPDRIASARRDLLAHLEPGSLQRLRLLLADPSAGLEAFAEEGVAFARRLADDGRWGAATSVLEESARALRSQEESAGACSKSLRLEVFATWIDLVCKNLVPSEIERAIYELRRVRDPSAELLRLGELAQGAIEVNQDPRRAIERLDAVGPMWEPRVERTRASVRMVAARSLPVGLEARILEDIERWAQSTEDSETHARRWGWRGRLAYRRGEFAEAAELHLRSAALLGRSLDKAIALFNAASALLEAFQPARAVEHARSALELLRSRRHPALEARGEWILRAAAYRMGNALAPDHDLVAAALRTAPVALSAVLQLTEAAIAWRAGSLDDGRRLAEAAAASWSALSVLPDLIVLARSLAAVCGGAAPAGLFDDIASRAAHFETMGVGLQVLGLLAMLDRSRAPEWRPVARSLWERIAAPHRSDRMDVLSADEALQAIERAPRAESSASA